jgi:hypothetical protein
MYLFALRFALFVLHFLLAKKIALLPAPKQGLHLPPIH